MTRNELDKVFEWLEENMNTNSQLEFRLTNNKKIGAYIKDNEDLFCTFDIGKILYLINDWNDESEDEE